MITFEFTPPGESKTFQAVGQPLQLEGQNFGALIVAKKKTELTNGWFSLFELLLVALGVGLVVAGALAWYLSRRIAKPVLALSAAADRIADGKYDIAVPDVPGSGEVSHLAERFRQMASRLAEAEEQERNFLMSVSHELRTPLTAIRGHVEALREGLIDDPDAEAESLSVVAMEAERLERLVGDVLDLAKLDAHRFTVLHEEVDMGSLVDQVYAAYGEEARRRGIDYVCDGNGGGPVIVSDGDRVFQIVSNLLNNAFRWTPDGGRIELALVAANGTISVSVADTGPGIKPADQERIFRPFWSRDGGGTGLGLAIARELAVALGGRIELESEPGAGSRFDLKLPATPPSVGSRRWPSPSPRRGASRAPLSLGMRPKQWSKNLLLFAGLLFANELGDATRWLRGVRRVRRVLRGIERRVSRERRPGRGARPRAPGEAPAAGGERRAPRERGARACRRARCGGIRARPRSWARGRSSSWRRFSSSRRRTPAA